MAERNPVPLSLTQPFIFSQPLDMEDAREALVECARNRHQARDWLQRATKDAAEKERAYRIERANAWARHTEGTAKEREDQVRKATVEFGYQRDLAVGIIKAAQERLEEVDAERASLHRLVDWSMKIVGSLEPQASNPIPARREAA